MPSFEQSWSRAWRGAGANADNPTLYAELLSRYQEPHRAYHTLQHLGECLDYFAEVASLAEHPAAVELALWFHDAIYDVRASDNEARSAEWASSALLAAGAAESSAELVKSLVLATRHTTIPTTVDEQVLVDIDLSILGASEERFAQYEEQIRREYHHVPSIIFRAKRKTILRSFLQRTSIFSTVHFRTKFEQAARRNLSRATGENVTAIELISALYETVTLLNRHGVSHWAKWFERDCESVAKGDFYGVEHLLTAFGGMGSFNDLYLCKSNGHAISENEESEVNANLSRLRSRLYDLAAQLKRDREKL